MSRRESGLMVAAVGRGEGAAFARRLRLSHPLTTVRLSLELGRATRTGLASSETVEKTTYKHVTEGKVAALLASVQAAHQRHTFESANVPLQSQV